MITPQMKELGRWMVMETPDREVVKMGIILLGVSHDIESIPLLKSIAKHGEFTYYVGLALYEMTPQWDLMLIDIIEPLYYWGRIMAVILLLDYHPGKKCENGVLDMDSGTIIYRIIISKTA